MPPCIWTHSSAAFTAASQQAAFAKATATGVSESAAARQPAAYLAAARAWVTDTHRSASRCLSPWNDPTGRAGLFKRLQQSVVELDVEALDAQLVLLFAALA